MHVANVLRLLVVVSLLIIAPRLAHAEWPPCSQAEVTTEAVTTLERIARDRGATFDKDHDSSPCVIRMATEPKAAFDKLAARATAACATILTRDPKYALCIDFAALGGKATLGGVDIAKVIASRDLDPWATSETFTMLEIERLKLVEMIPVIEKRWRELANKKGRDVEHRLTTDDTSTIERVAEWGNWRISAAATIGALGGADDRRFLAEQLDLLQAKSGASDKGSRNIVSSWNTSVGEACRSALAALDKRLAAKR